MFLCVLVRVCVWVCVDAWRVRVRACGRGCRRVLACVEPY